MNDNSNDRLILSKAQDTIDLSVKRNTPCFLGFLNENEVQLIKDNIYLSEQCVFYGGFDGALRLIFGCGVNKVSDFPLVAVRFLYKKEYKLTHRDFLGSLMATGIERSTIGDILTGDGETIVILKRDVVNHVLNEVTKVGRVGVRASISDISDINYECKFVELSFTVSSLRLDVIVSALCNMSRDCSQKLIKADSVAINHRITDNVSKQVVVGDIITIRKFGKFVFAEDNGFSKKGKYKITVKHFR